MTPADRFEIDADRFESLQGSQPVRSRRCEKRPSAGAPAARETPQPYRLNNLRREPSCAGFHVHMRELDAGWCDVDRAEHDRQREPARPDGARVEHGDPAVDADEWYVRDGFEEIGES